MKKESRRGTKVEGERERESVCVCTGGERNRERSNELNAELE